MDHPQTPRIMAPHLQQFQHKGVVRILGKVVQLRGEKAVIDAGGNIDVMLNRVSLRPIRTRHPLEYPETLPAIRLAVLFGHAQVMRGRFGLTEKNRTVIWPSTTP